MLINVSTLLTEPVGQQRRYELRDEPVAVPSLGFAQTVSGQVRLIRSERGVIVMASLDVQPVSLTCARCLQAYDTPVRIEFDEEYVLDRDPLTGERIEADQDEFRIDHRRHLDLSEAVRQYEESALPIQPLCRPDCLGLCSVCGQNLNEGECACRAAEADDRWSGLTRLAEQLHTEESNGRPEA